MSLPAMCRVLQLSNASSPCFAEALAAVGESNADNWVVMQKGLPLLIAMLQAPDLRQAEAAVSLQTSDTCSDLATW